jgi:hypothetical protein
MGLATLLIISSIVLIFFILIGGVLSFLNFIKDSSEQEP